MDRYNPISGPSAERARPAVDLASVAGGLVAVALPPASVALLRLFPPLQPDVHGLGWLLPAAGAVAAAAIAGGMVLCLEWALRHRSLPGLLRAAALGVLVAGLTVASLRVISGSERSAFPDGGLAITTVAAAALLLLAQLGAAGGRSTADRSPVVWLLLFGVIEAGVAAAIILPPASDAWPWVLGPAAALVAASAVSGPWLPAGLLATGVAALAAARLGSVDVLPGLVAVAAGGLAYARRHGETAATAGSADEMMPATSTGAVSAEPASGGPLTDPDDEAMRLARELRGTIEELLRARRTIELQREEIAQASTVDALTGVATRRAILERLRIEAAEARRYQHPVAVMLLDVDGFAQVNHEHGMAIGDEVLREVALRLRLRVRAADALGRVGGDSFLALLPHTDETGAATFADALRRLLVKRPIDTSKGEVTVGISIGVAFMRPGMPLDDEQLLAAADEALASARAAGGNRIAFDRMHGLIRLEERQTPPGGGAATRTG